MLRTVVILEWARGSQKAEAVAVGEAKRQGHFHFVDKTNKALNERIKILNAENDDLQRRNQLLQIRLSPREKRNRKARIEEPIDSRTFRRTFGSLQRRAGTFPVESAARPNPQVIHPM